MKTTHTPAQGSTNRESGSGKLVVLAVALVALLVAGGLYAVLSGPAPEETVEGTMIPAEDTDMFEPLDDVQEQDATTGLEESPAPTAAGDVDINVEQAMAPRTLGNPDAPVKVIEYASLTCNHCATFHNDIFPQIKEKYIDTGLVHFEFREFPLNDPALKATLTARCLPPARYVGFVSMLFKTQAQWAGNLSYMNTLKQNARLAGLSDEAFDACHQNSELMMAVAEQMQEAQDKWQINATPSFIINDGAEKLSGVHTLESFERVFRAVSDGEVGGPADVE